MLSADGTHRELSRLKLLETKYTPVDNRATRSAARRHYQNRKAVALCTYFGCSASPKAGRTLCHKHLARMSERNKKRVRARKAKGVCVYCGTRPQFWGIRCVLCRQLFAKHPLPYGARRALRLYREAEKKCEIEQRQVQARFAVRKLLATGHVNGDYAKALRLYAGLDTGVWRTYEEVGGLMHRTKERVRQLLYPSKVILSEMLGGNLPWKPPSEKRPSLPNEKSWREPRWSRGSKGHMRASVTHY